jgi:molybdopterin synthase sulfur carrier subunit
VKLLYFSWFKEKTGVSEEEIDLPSDVSTVDELLTWLKARDSRYAEAFAEPSVVRTAVNQAYARGSDAVGPNDEVAFFPPVTGG